MREEKAMIEATALEKRYRQTTALDDVSFVARPGRITALVGGPGAGKTTILRILLGLERPTRGQALIKGQRFDELRSPMSRVGAVLDHLWVYQHRSARTHLRWLALSGGIGQARVNAVLELMDLLFAADKHISTFSNGMLLRLAVAGALLGDPEVVVVDRLFNDHEAGDVAGVVRVLAQLANEEDRTVLVTAQMPGDIALLADDIVILDAGCVVARSTTDEFIAQTGGDHLRIRSPQLGKLEEALRGTGAETSWETDSRFGGATANSPALIVQAAERQRAGAIAARHEVVLSQVASSGRTFEETIIHMISTQRRSCGPVTYSPASGAD